MALLSSSKAGFRSVAGGETVSKYLGRAVARSRSRRPGAADSATLQWPFLAPALIFLLLASVYPILQLLHMSIADVRPPTISKVWPIVGLRQFAEVIVDDQFREALLNTIVYTLIVV